MIRDSRNGWRFNFRIWLVRRRRHAFDHQRSTPSNHWCRCGAAAERDWTWPCAKTNADITLSAMFTNRERRTIRGTDG